MKAITRSSGRKSGFRDLRTLSRYYKVGYQPSTKEKRAKRTLYNYITAGEMRKAAKGHKKFKSEGVKSRCAKDMSQTTEQ